MAFLNVKFDKLGNRRVQPEDKNTARSNQRLMLTIKKMHSVVENVDLDKQRHTQDNFGALFGTHPAIEFKQADIDGIDAEWTKHRHPGSTRRLILYCHGGGYATGSCRYARSITAKLAVATGLPVLAFNYRLAPENPYPAAIEDAMLIWNHFMQQGVGAEDVIVIGDSAGGNLVLELVLELKRQERRLPKVLVLLSPWTDMTLSGASHQEKAEIDPVLEKKYMEKMISYYAPGLPLDDGKLSPLFADFTGFPPTYIQVGQNEILLDDSKRLYDKLLSDKVLVRLEEYEGMWHVFQMAPFKRSFDAIREVADFIYEICR